MREYGVSVMDDGAATGEPDRPTDRPGTRTYSDTFIELHQRYSVGLGRETLRDAKVANLDLALVGEQDICGLNAATTTTTTITRADRYWRCGTRVSERERASVSGGHSDLEVAVHDSAQMQVHQAFE